MIKNPVQYRVTHLQAQTFEACIGLLLSDDAPADVTLHEARIDVCRGMVTGLRKEIAEYEETQSAVTAERERCARIADECFERDYPHQDPSYVEGCKETAEVIAARIRERK